MKIGKVNSRLTRFGSKVRGDISKAVGKTSKGITQVERGLKKGVDVVASAADSKAVKGLQQATGIAGKALLAGGALGGPLAPVALAAGGALTSAHEGIKATRKAIPDKAEKAKKQIGGVARQGRATSTMLGREAIAGTRKADEFRKNVLERPEPKANLMSELPMYVD
jgi:hypothetical protein